MRQITAELVYLAFTAAKCIDSPKAALEYEARPVSFDQLTEKDQNASGLIASFINDRYKQADISAGVIYLAVNFTAPEDNPIKGIAFLDLSAKQKTYYACFAAALLALALLEEN